MIHDFYRWFFADLGMEAPHPLRCLAYVAAAGLLSLAIWAFLVLWLAALA
jgi:hypothetical protein